MIHKGTLFWYRARGKKYAGLILEEIGHSDYYLVLLSEEITCPETVENIMELPAYTAAWFGSLDMLPEFRFHIIAEGIPLEGFNGYAGGFYSKEKIIINNCGHSKTWKHEYRNLGFHSKKMKDQTECAAYYRVHV